MGETGNAYGAHLDLEFYNADGTISDPSMFSGFASAESNPFTSEAAMAIKSSLPAIKMGSTEYQGPEIKQYSDVNQEVPQAPQQPQFSEVTSQYPDTQLNQAPRPVMDTVEAAGDVVGQGIEKLNLTGDRGLGISEMLQGKPEAAAAEINRTNPFGTFDLGITETLQNRPEAARQALSGTAERSTRNLPTAGRFDLGITEAIRGDAEGSAQVRQATLDNIQRKIQENYGTATTAVTDFLNQFRQQAAPQAGEGLSFAKSAYDRDLETSPMKMNEETQFENQGTANAAATQGQIKGVSTEGQVDIRDPFFKSGEYQQYSKYLPENADQISGGALDTSIFDKGFFERRDAEGDIGNVFGGTFLESKAQGKFSDYKTAENEKAISAFKSRFGSSYDQGDVNRIISQAKSGGGFIDANSLPEPKRKKVYSLSDYLGMGKTAAQWYAETGRQSTLDAIGADPRQNINLDTGAISRVGESSGGGGSSSHYSGRSGFSSGGGYSGGGGGGGGGGSWSPSTQNKASSHYSSRSGFSPGGGYSGGGGGGGGGGSWGPSNSSSKNIFQRAASSISNLFKRIF